MFNRKKVGPGVCLSLVMLVSCFMNGSLLASNKKNKFDSINVASEKSFDAHKPFTSLHFSDPEMDFAFALILGATINHGCEIGEAFYTASQIKEGDATSWQKEWIETGKRTEDRGVKALENGHKISAREQFMRASYYYRAALISMMPDNPNFKKTAEESRELLTKAGQYLTPKMEYIEIPYEDTKLPGYFWKADDNGKPAKTLIMIGGGETFAEDLFFYIAPMAHERGYNFVTVDLPGQGLLPLEGKCFEPDMYKPLDKVVDYALNRPEVDSDKLAVFGISGGGGFVPQTAMHDKRIKAIVMNSAVIDAQTLFATMPVATTTEDILKIWSTFKQNTVKVIAWRWGVKMNNIPGLVKANKGFDFDPAKVTCPALAIVGEGEYANKEVKRQQKECMDNLASTNKKLIVTPTDEGASNHCITENRSVMSQEVFDWLDDVFNKSK